MTLDVSFYKNVALNVQNPATSEPKSYKLSRKNIGFIQVAYKMGNVIGITPWYDFEEKLFKHPVINLVYSILLGAILVSTLLMTIRTREFMDEQVVQKFLVTLADVISLILTIFLIAGATFPVKEKWKVLLENFASIDDKLENNHNEQHGVISTFYVQLISAHVFFIGCYLYKAFIWWDILGIKYFSNFGTMVIPMYYCFFSALLMGNIVLAFQCRYQDLNEMLREKVEIGATSEANFINYITLVRKYYRHLADTVECFNDLFGWIIVLTLLHSIIEILNCVNLLLRSFIDPTFSWGVFSSCLWICCLSMGGAIYIVLCCDSASMEGTRIIRLCYKFQDNFQVPSDGRKELLKLAHMATSYRPNFLAANFFVVERSTILGIISIATTYLIVVIQFNSSLFKKD